jgi:DNA repair photolyase
MEEKLAVKSNAADLLEKQLRLRAKKNQYGIIVMSSATDPYLQAEKDQQLTRRLLEIILAYRFPLHVITKSDLVTRDFDLLEKINAHAILPPDLKDKIDKKVFITFSFSTTDDRIGNIFEPGATTPTNRIKAMQSAIDNGFMSGVSLMPLLPYITDTAEHLESMFSIFKSSGVKYIFPASLTLFGNGNADSKTLVMRAIEKHYPHLKEKYSLMFSGSDQVPYSYQQALREKTKMLCNKYEIQNALY